ncbi:MAG: cytochrome c3 family protein [Anaerolineae bacterium]
MWVAALLLALLAGMPAGALAQADNDFCLGCHGVPDGLGPPVEPQEFEASAHGALPCLACHDTAEEVPHPEAMTRPACGVCHNPQTEEYEMSVHGVARARGDREAASCTDCHDSPHRLRQARDPGSSVYPLNLPRTCGRCHGDPELAKRHGIRATNVYQLYMDSIHGKAITRSGLLVAATCSSCHGAHKIRARGDPASRVHRTNVPKTCGGCHAGILPVYHESIHGREAAAGNPVAPICTDCHTAHEIRRIEVEAWKLEIVRECGTCHAESLRTYRDTFHGQVTALGFTRVARCSDCHGAHDILPARDSLSRVHPANRVATCRTCHPAANANFAKYDPHADHENRARNPLLYYTARFMTWLLVGVFAFFGLHTTLWGARALVAKRRGERPPSEPKESA